MIPKRVYFYWGGRLSWLHYLSLYSFHKQNPAWAIEVYRPKVASTNQDWHSGEQSIIYQGEDWFPKLKSLATVKTFDIAKLGFSTHLSEVHKSDIFRLWVLLEKGGFYSDFDILYYSALKVNHQFVYCHEGLDYRTGLIGSVKGHRLLEELLQLAKGVSPVSYQAYGPGLWREYFSQNPEPQALNLPKDSLYPYDWQQVDKLYEKGNFKQSGIGLHWYGGSLKSEWDKFTPQNYSAYDTVITNLIKKIL